MTFIRVLENESNTAVDWPSLNEMIVNPKKFQLLISAKSNTKCFIGTPINIKGKTIYSTDSIQFLGINIDNELKFNEHVGSLCKKVGQQLNSLYRLYKYLTCESKKFLVNSFNFFLILIIVHLYGISHRQFQKKRLKKFMSIHFDFYMKISTLHMINYLNGLETPLLKSRRA